MGIFIKNLKLKNQLLRLTKYKLSERVQKRICFRKNLFRG